MNDYNRLIWALTIGMMALAITFYSSLFGILIGIGAIVFGKKTMSEKKSKMAYAGFWLGITAVVLGIVFWIINIVLLYAA